uniref:hypothetical protein n=1 Tax=Cupriavidus taiwanensis TaxID=164546 RepID=UPI00358FCE95
MIIPNIRPRHILVLDTSDPLTDFLPLHASNSPSFPTYHTAALSAAWSVKSASHPERQAVV